MFDCSPSMMLLYHRPVPAKIPKRRSRAGKHLCTSPQPSYRKARYETFEILLLTADVVGPI